MHQIITLSSGLKLLLAPMPTAQSVTSMVFVGAGSRYETKEINGISHFLEHMFFKGTEKRPSAQSISEEIDTIGGEFNAGTSKEYTVFYVKARDAHLELSLDVLADMMQNSKFDEEELEREKGVILEELKMYEDTPMRDISDVFEQTVWGDQPLGWKTIGTKQAISATTREKMLGYKDSLYTLDNMIVGVAGKFDPERVTALAEQYFSDLPVTRSTSWTETTEEQTSPIIHLRAKPTEQAHMCLGVRALKRTDPRRYAMKVMNVALGANMSSRLFINIRERQGLCYYIRSSANGYYDTGTLEIQAGIDLTRVYAAIPAILSELKQLTSEQMEPKELNKAKEYIKGRVVLALEDTSGIIEWLGMQELLEGEIKSIDDVFAAIDAVTAAEIQALAQDIFTDANLNLAVIAPDTILTENKLKKIVTFDQTS